MMLLLIFVPACSGKGSDHKDFPKDFNSLSDQQKVAYMMDHAPADSVARFIIYASLGKIEGIRIDTINNATLMAYENYKDTALQTFSWEFDRLSEELPLPDQMKLYSLVGAEDPQGLGLTLGLEYLNQIRVKDMTTKDVLAELKELKKACVDDPDLYARFIIGFRTVLRYDKNSDMPRDIYTSFLNYDEAAVQDYYKRNKYKPSPGISSPTDSISESESDMEEMPEPEQEPESIHTDSIY